MPKEYFECMCGGEVLVADIWDEEDSWEFYLAIFGLPSLNYWGWKERLRLIWRIIRRGRPYVDEIVFDKKEFIKFKNYINSITIGNKLDIS